MPPADAQGFSYADIKMVSVITCCCLCDSVTADEIITFALSTAPVNL